MNQIIPMNQSRPMMDKNSLTFSLILSAIIISTAAVACSDSSSEKKDDSNTKAVQEPKLEDVDAEEIQQVINGFKNNKAVLVNVWATWCAPCIEEFPEIVEIQRTYPDDLQVIFISADFSDQRDRAKEFLEKQNVDWTTYFKADKDEPFINALSEDWSGALPFTKIIDTNGNEIAHWENKADFDTFNKHVKQAIKP